MRLAAGLPLVLLGCLAAPELEQPNRANWAAAAIRHCATVTQHCSGMAALARTYPGNCQALPHPACLVATNGAKGREWLGAVEMSGGDICGYRRLEGGGAMAILGRISTSRDGTVQFTTARFPKGGSGLPKIRTLAELRRECTTIN